MANDAVPKEPINRTVDFQLGVLFSRADRTDERIEELRCDQKAAAEETNIRFVALSNEVKARAKDTSAELVALEGRVNDRFDKNELTFREALAEQTGQLRPIIEASIGAKAIAANRKQAFNDGVNFWVKVAAIVTVASACIGGTIALVNFGLHHLIDFPTPVRVVPSK